MTMDEELTVVIGAGRYPDGASEIALRGGVEDSLMCSLVLEASIKRHSPGTKIINTYHVVKPRMKNRKNPTPFSLVRFMVPWLCDFRGWALYCDADQLVFGDVRELLHLKNSVSNPPAVYIAKSVGCTGVVFMDTSRLQDWDAWDVCKRIDNGHAQYSSMMTQLNGFGFGSFGDLGKEWNTHDEQFTQKTKILHYTNLRTQPWKFPGVHRFEPVWAEQLGLAIDEGYVKTDMLDENCRKILNKAREVA